MTHPFPDERTLRSLHRDYRLFPECLEELLAARRLLEGYPELSRRAEAFCQTLRAEDCREDPAAGELSRLAFFIALLARIPAYAEELAWLRLPEDVLRRNLEAFEAPLLSCRDRSGRIGCGIHQLHWLRRILALDIHRVGGFHFERRRDLASLGAVLLRNRRTGETAAVMDGVRLHREGMALGSALFEDGEGSFKAELSETAESFEGYAAVSEGLRASPVPRRFDRAEWELAAGRGDDFLALHIPKGTALSIAALEEDARRALEIFGAVFPDFRPRALTCVSWLMSPELNALLRKDSNILRFAAGFRRFPVRSAGREASLFLLGRPDADWREAPESTSLLRALKTLYMNGGVLHSYGGVRIF